MLTVSSDAALRSEIEDALGSCSSARPVPLHAGDVLRAVETVRSRRPRYVIVDLDRDLSAFRTLAREVLAVAPELVVIGAYRPRPGQGDEGRESSALFVDAVRAGARDFLRRPVTASDLSAVLDRFGRDVTEARLNIRLAPTTAFVSNKGGVGKSTLAVNAAVRLARRHAGGVLLIDASLQLGVCDSMLDLRPETSLVDAARERERLDGTLLRQLAVRHDSGLDLLAAPPDALAAGEVDEETLSQVITLARREYQFVVVDTFPLFDRTIMSILDVSDLTFVVLDPVVPTVLGAAKLLRLMDGLDYPRARQRVVVNRFTRLASSPTLEDIADRLGSPIDVVLPNDRRVITSANSGQPLPASRFWRSKLDRGLDTIIREIEAQLDRTPYHHRDETVASGDTSGLVVDSVGPPTRHPPNERVRSPVRADQRGDSERPQQSEFPSRPLSGSVDGQGEAFWGATPDSAGARHDV